jgi:hypothetical protein
MVFAIMANLDLRKKLRELMYHPTSDGISKDCQINPSRFSGSILTKVRILAGQKTCNIFKSEKFVRLIYPFDITTLYIV